MLLTLQAGLRVKVKPALSYTTMDFNFGRLHTAGKRERVYSILFGINEEPLCRAKHMCTREVRGGLRDFCGACKTLQGVSRTCSQNPVSGFGEPSGVCYFRRTFCGFDKLGLTLGAYAQRCIHIEFSHMLISSSRNFFPSYEPPPQSP